MITEREILDELKKIEQREEQILAEIDFHMNSITNSAYKNDGRSRDLLSPLLSGSDSQYLSPKQSTTKIESFLPCFEALDQDAGRLITQITNCTNIFDEV